MRLRFLSGNSFKIGEAKSILGSAGFEIIPIDFKIEELQTQDGAALVRDKCIKAFDRIGRPLFVEHTGLYLQSLNGFPGGLTQIFWDTIQADKFAQLFGQQSETGVIAKTVIGYCDGKKIYQFSGEIEGNVPAAPQGDRAFQWDCVFIPKGHTETFAQMGGDKKNAISMRRKALDTFLKHLSA